ncbi:hypothetical protein G647_02932 [Cladophialophora carrionii CBS 160.54]|uniref:Major facilitator superfamily (MFS) profile domain-containing protein n=1 Tax=Cladophialophora carrionii CBS 160.54 TaxID=1279043 RepID=V9DH26_9EURO|nr:uncharacterized protein G647_02932 [Cladophialophora carrionii CBS 160.54]ETI26155.1 hypothetical protein G647_02932 [Cladophialophora carrionii CBS 160.54]
MTAARGSRFSAEARPSNETTIAASIASAVVDEEKNQATDDRVQSDSENEDDNQEALDAAWGKNGRVWMWIGIALMWTIFELDHATIYNYQNYAASDFEEVALLGALMTAGTIVSAVLKPPIAKISDVIGRAETYMAVVVFYVASYILCASAKGFGQYTGGYVIYCIGQTGMQILNQIIVADITSSRWRGLANGLVNLPFMIIPWCSAFIVDSALANIGWRWGIGMFAIIMPICSVAVIIPLVWFQRRLRRVGGTVRNKTSMRGFLSQIDLGGMVLLSGGCAMLLLPIALAGNTSGSWRAPWVPTLIALGVVFLLVLVYYESRIASKPVIPPRFVKNVSLILAFLIGLLDAFAYSVTHTYLYAWATVVHEFTPRNATFLTYAAGCVQVLTGLGTGFLMYRSKRYKWLLLIGVIIRLIGYGFMMRLRGANNSIGEIFVMQIIQGAGSGMVGTVVIVVAQVVVPRAELAQSTALELLFIYLGNSIGSSIAGTIYTSLFKPRLRFWMGPDTPQSAINSVYDTITDVVPQPGSSERMAVNHAYSDILRYMTIAALVASAIPMVMVWFLPNLKLNDKHNLAGDLTGPENSETEAANSPEETRVQKWKRRIRW